MIVSAPFDPISANTNKRVTVYSVTWDAYHQETRELLGDNLPARVVYEVDKSRMYRPDKSRADTVIYSLVIYISAVGAGKDILEALKIGDVVIVDGEEYRIVDIYKGYHLAGDIAHIKATLA